jgi:F420-dependent oxidoreductase-like protein
MSDNEQRGARPKILTATEAISQPNSARIGLVIEAGDASEAVRKIVEAEANGLQQVWMTQSTGADSLTLYAAAVTQTQRIRVGTAIVPTYPRHPLVMAQQALALNDLAPDRLRLGVGPSHRPTIEGVYGLPHTTPLAHLREYVHVLRDILWEGKTDFHGSFFNVTASLARTPATPILVSTLGLKAFRLAGEISDGALSWLCPTSYLLDKALPELRAGAEAVRRPTPPLVAHVVVVMSQDRDAVQSVVRSRLSMYAKLPFYAHMFAEAGHPVAADGTGLSELADALVVSGDERAVQERLQTLLSSGLDELLITMLPVQDEVNERRSLMKVIATA